MQQAIIDCLTGKVSYIELSFAEESHHLEEIEKRKVEVVAGQEAELKRRLVQELVELREMKLNPDLFTVKDVTDKQAIVDKVTEKLGLFGILH